MKKTPVAWFQLIYKKSRLAIAISGITFATTLIFTQLGIEAALYNSTTAMHRLLRGELVMLHPETDTLLALGNFSKKRLYQSLGFNGVESVSPIYFRIHNFKNLENGNKRIIGIFGINPNEIPFEIENWEQHRPYVQLTDVMIFDGRSRPEFGITYENFDPDKGVNIEIIGRRIKVNGIVDFVGPSFGWDGNIIGSDLTFYNVLPNHDPDLIQVGVIMLGDNVDPQKVKQELIDNLPNDVKILTKEEFIEIETYYWNNTTAIGFIFAMGVVVGFVVGVIIVYQILYTEISDHLSDYAIMKARGYGNWYFIGMILQETFILSILGFLPGYFLSLGIYQLTIMSTELPIFMTLSRTILVFVLTVVMCFTSGSIAAYKLKEADAAELL